VKSIVLLACGHWFREHRGNHADYPVDGEERRCPSRSCGDRKYPALYLADMKLTPLGWPDHLSFSYCSDDVD
jgi:hypothetical protein